MKKAALLGGLAVVFAAPGHALETDVVLDGTIGFSASYFDTDVSDNTTLHNNASRIGLFASASEGGIKGFIRYERGMDIYNPDSNGRNSMSDDYVREFFAGVETAYGTVAIGRMRSDYARAGERVDPFYDTSVTGFTGLPGTAQGQGANYGQSNLSNGFSDRVINLRSANYGGLQFNAAIFADSAESNDHDYGLGVTYRGQLIEGQPFEVSVQALEIRNMAVSGVPFNDDASVGGSPGKSTNVRVSAIYEIAGVTLGGSYERVDVDAERRERHYSALSATFGLTERLRLAGTLSRLDFPTSGGTTVPPLISGYGATVGAFYSFSNALNSYAAVRYIDFDDAPAIPNGSTSDSLGVAVGLSYSFDIDLR
jgi:hypothetical protein